MNEQEQLLRFQNVIDQLIDPEKGCPWDKEQTALSMCEYLIEECHELVDAIRSNKPGHACDEMGDLLFVLLLMARRFELAGQFSLGDALKIGADKMVRRHPHVFSGESCDSMDDLMKNWAAIKKAEKEAEVMKEKKLLEVKEKFLNKKSELEKEVQQRNHQIQQNENRLKQREISLNQRNEELGRRKNELDNQQNRLENEKKALVQRQEELDKLQQQERAKLEELSGLSAEEAKVRLVESMKDEAKTEAQSYINEIMDEAKLNANAESNAEGGGNLIINIGSSKK